MRVDKSVGMYTCLEACLSMVCWCTRVCRCRHVRRRVCRLVCRKLCRHARACTHICMKGDIGYWRQRRDVPTFLQTKLVELRQRPRFGAHILVHDGTQGGRVKTERAYRWKWPAANNLEEDGSFIRDQGLIVEKVHECPVLCGHPPVATLCDQLLARENPAKVSRTLLEETIDCDGLDPPSLIQRVCELRAPFHCPIVRACTCVYVRVCMPVHACLHRWCSCTCPCTLKCTCVFT